MQKIRKRSKFGNWKLIKFLGSGGNGVVWLAKNSGGEMGAIKILSNLKGRKTYERFKVEIDVLIKNSDIKGILPILDLFLPENIDTEFPWYVMPVAQPITEYLEGKTYEDIALALFEISKTLAQLHERGVSHRDIKPANLLVINGSYFIGDFGLADCPEKPDLTASNERIGAMATIAPEMRRKGDKSNGIAADVYSISKTLWILLTGITQGFDGQYNADSVNGISNFKLVWPKDDWVYIKEDVPQLYTNPIDDLLRRCTSDNPAERPNIVEFTDKLMSWLEILKNFEQRNQLQWEDIHSVFFPSEIPDRAFWSNIEVITRILNFLGTIDNLNHMHFPSGGGQDLLGAKIGLEDRTIELNFGSRHVYVVQPQRLLFESFGYDLEWNYFRLETGGLEPIGVGEIYRNRETVVELEPLEYVERDCWDIGEYRGEELPSTARLVSRFISGDFVIVSKRSMYNRASTYTGVHNRMNSDEFRNYIAEKIAIARDIQENNEVQQYAFENGINMDEFIYTHLSNIFRDEYLDELHR